MKKNNNVKFNMANIVLGLIVGIYFAISLFYPVQDPLKWSNFLSISGMVVAILIVITNTVKILKSRR